MNLDISPFESVGPLRFGQSRFDVRRQFGPDFDTFRKDVGENETDAYDAFGLHLYYDADDRLEFVEVFEPARPSFRGVKLLGRDINEVAAELRVLGYEGYGVDVGIQYDDLGFVLNANTSNLTEGVSAFRLGYYDSD